MVTPRWPAVLPYLLSRRARHESDVSAADELNWRNFPVDLPRGLELQWLGTAGFRMTCEGTTVVVDPYMSRADKSAVIFRKTLLPRPEAVALIGRTDAVLVGHTHFDHAVDVPALAARDQATVYGSQSAANLLRLHGLEKQAVVAEPYHVYEIGPFEVTFVPSVHSKLVLGLKVPYDGELSCDALEGLTAPAYTCGQVWGIHIKVGGTTFYHQGSCNLLDDAIQHTDIDVFMAGIAGRGFTERYWERILSRLSPRLILPHHYDDFFRPADAPLEFSFNVNFARFTEEIAAVSNDFAIRTLEPLQTVCGH